MGFQSLDFFRKLPRDMETTSAIGGFFTILAFIVGAFLIISEYSLYNNDTLIKEMTIDNIKGASHFRINLDLIFYSAPCSVLSICQENDLGHHSINKDNIKFARLDKDQNQIGQGQLGDKIVDYQGSQDQVQDLFNAIQNQEGCRMHGFVIASKVPGNFHFSFHDYQDVIGRVQKLGAKIENLKIDYKINHLSFGYQITEDQLNKFFHGMASEQNPYDNVVKRTEEGTKVSYNHFLKIIPNRFINQQNNIDINTFQFSMNSRQKEIESSQLPAIYMNYEISPITIAYSTKQNSFYHFIVEICAIVGGIFAVIGIINSLTQVSYQAIKKKD